MSMSIKKSRLFKLFAVVALAVIMAIGTALPSLHQATTRNFTLRQKAVQAMRRLFQHA